MEAQMARRATLVDPLYARARPYHQLAYEVRGVGLLRDAEVLVRTNAATGCTSAPMHLYVLWGTRGTSRPWNWGWTMDVWA